jgi:hypothetical protein
VTVIEKVGRFTFILTQSGNSYRKLPYTVRPVKGGQFFGYTQIRGKEKQAE